MTDDELHNEIVDLVRTALAAATRLEEFVDCTRAAVATGDKVLLDEFWVRLAREAQEAANSSGAWESELTYNKVEAWSRTGHKAELVAEAYGMLKAARAG